MISWAHDGDVCYSVRAPGRRFGIVRFTTPSGEHLLCIGEGLAYRTDRQGD